jgi:transcriptional activator HAC1
MDGILLTQSSNTVNPASLSPILCPVPEEEEEDWLAQNESSTPAAAHAAEAPATSEETSPDATQLPAAKLCSDLQCRSAEAPPQSQLTVSVALTQLWLFQTLFFPLQLWIISSCHQPLLQVAMSTRVGFSLPQTPAILNTIIWFVTTRRRTSPEAATTTTSTSPSSSPTISTSFPQASANSSSTVPTTAPAPASRSPTLRLRSLLRILSCSPHLARPLRDATLEVLRLVVSRQTLDVDMVDGADWSTTGSEDGLPSPRLRQQQGEGSEYLKYVPGFYGGRLPSMEALFTLAWICEIELIKQKRQLEVKTMDVEVEESQNDLASKLGSRIQSSFSGLMKLEYSTWEAERGFDLDPKQRLLE